MGRVSLLMTSNNASSRQGRENQECMPLSTILLFRIKFQHLPQTQIYCVVDVEYSNATRTMTINQVGNDGIMRSLKFRSAKL